MIPPPVVSAGIVFLGTLVVGIALHELSHAVALRLTGVPCTVEVLPARDGPGVFRTSLRSPVARVTPTEVPEDLPSWQLRAAAMMPLSLAVPFALVVVGVVPDPFAVGDLSLELATIAWLGCALPSPGDFSLLWYPDRAMAAFHGG